MLYVHVRRIFSDSYEATVLQQFQPFSRQWERSWTGDRRECVVSLIWIVIIGATIKFGFSCTSCLLFVISGYK